MTIPKCFGISLEGTTFEIVCTDKACHLVWKKSPETGWRQFGSIQSRALLLREDMPTNNVDNTLIAYLVHRGWLDGALSNMFDGGTVCGKRSDEYSHLFEAAKKVKMMPIFPIFARSPGNPIVRFVKWLRDNADTIRCEAYRRKVWSVPHVA